MADRLSSIYASSAFWIGAGERAIKTAAQAALAFLATASAGVLEWDFPALASITGGAVVLSVLTSLADPHRAANAESVAWVVKPSFNEPPRAVKRARHSATDKSSGE